MSRTRACILMRYKLFLIGILIFIYLMKFATYPDRIFNTAQRETYQINYQLADNPLPWFLDRKENICPLVISEKLNPLFTTIFKNLKRVNHSLPNLADYHECRTFKQIEGSVPIVSREELEFPLAFAFNVHKEYDQFSRLFRAVYREHNAYCIHVDFKAPRDFRENVQQMAKCFGSNVHVIPQTESIDIKWGDFGTMEAWIRCATHFLNKSSVAWKYMLNGSGQEFPMRTNWELVKALKAINGSNIVESDYPNTGKRRAPAKPLSFNITWFKSSIYTALRREMVTFALNDKRATEILSALRTEGKLVKLQDEVFFTTLNYNPHLNAPGGCPEVHRPNDSDPRSAFISRFAVWLDHECLTGLRRKTVCILGLRFIPMLTKGKEFFANKFLYDFEPLAYDCLEWWIFQKIKHEREFRTIVREFDTTFYRNLYCSKNHL